MEIRAKCRLDNTIFHLVFKSRLSEAGLGLVAASVAAQNVVIHLQPSHSISDPSFFAFKREFLSLILQAPPDAVQQCQI